MFLTSIFLIGCSLPKDEQSFVVSGMELQEPITGNSSDYFSFPEHNLLTDPLVFPEPSVGCSERSLDSIAEAIQAFPDESTIKICSGVYYENLELIEQDVILEGEANVIIQPLHADLPIITLDNSTLHFSDLTFTHATAGVISLFDSWAEIDNSIFTDNASDETASVFYLEGSNVIISDSQIYHNLSSVDTHGAVELYDSETQPSNFHLDHVFWSSGYPVWNPVDRNTEWDVFFDGETMWGYRFNSFYNDDSFLCTTDENKFRGNYVGLCHLPS